MEKVIEFLNKTQIGFLATVEKNEPRVRPFQFQFEKDGKFYFCTASTKNVYQQLISNPYVEYSAITKEFSSIRLHGEIAISDNTQLKSEILENNLMLKQVYQSASNPEFILFYIEHGEVIICENIGQISDTFTF